MLPELFYWFSLLIHIVAFRIFVWELLYLKNMNVIHLVPCEYPQSDWCFIRHLWYNSQQCHIITRILIVPVQKHSIINSPKWVLMRLTKLSIHRAGLLNTQNMILSIYASQEASTFPSRKVNSTYLHVLRGILIHSWLWTWRNFVSFLRSLTSINRRQRYALNHF